jgi:biopolymer transport protein ExbB
MSIEETSLIAFLVKGGLVMIPIAALSVIAVALIIQKSVFFLRIRAPETQLGNHVIELLRSGSGNKALEELRLRRCPEAAVLLSGLLARKAGEGQEVIAQEMESQAKRHAVELERNVPYLSSIANLSTLLGLLGTVTGMINSFVNLREAGVSDPARLAGGISEALITTAAGLTVALPCLLFFHIFRQRVNGTLSRIEIDSSELLSFLSRQRRMRTKQ